MDWMGWKWADLSIRCCLFFLCHIYFWVKLHVNCTAWKEYKFGVFSGPYFPVFVLNTKNYSVTLRIQSECGKIRTRETHNLDTFQAALVGVKDLYSFLPPPHPPFQKAGMKFLKNWVRRWNWFLKKSAGKTKRGRQIQKS